MTETERIQELIRFFELYNSYVKTGKVNGKEIGKDIVYEIRSFGT